MTTNNKQQTTTRELEKGGEDDMSTGKQTNLKWKTSYALTFSFEKRNNGDSLTVFTAPGLSCNMFNRRT